MTTPVRTEDSFDAGAVHHWLTPEVDGLRGVPEVRQFSGGASNLTYLLRYPDRDLILRRPPVGRKAASAHDMRREYRVQRDLKPAYPYVPTVLAFCADHAVLGSDFYVMERIDGVIVRRQLPPEVTLDPGKARRLSETVVDRLVQLHQVDVEATGLADLGKGSGYVGRQVRGWAERYRAARTGNVPTFDFVIDWLAANQPADVATCVIHNDFRLDNLVLDGFDTLTVTGVLDWEMATLGDPLMDLAGTLAYWVQADDAEPVRANRMQPTDLPGMLTRREVFERYCDRMGFAPGSWLFYEVFGLFRLAVIAQQIYYRFHHGQTTNPAFKDFWMFVAMQEYRATTAIGSVAG